MFFNNYLLINYIFIFLIISIYCNLINEVVIFNKSEPNVPNYCNNTNLIQQSGLIRAPMGQFLGFPCSNEFYHCRWQSDGYRTYRKNCRTGLVYDVIGTQNCNYDYNVRGCSTGDNSVAANCTSIKDFKCPLSEDCVPLSKRCDGNYDCVLEEDEQNCPMCKAIQFPCVVSEQCIPIGQRCNGIKDCADGTDELDCENCGSGKFFCRKSGKCIQAKERCDGYAQCPNGEDEQLCKKARNSLSQNNMFLCESGTQQINQKQVCDGIVNCKYDASDEKYCQRSTGFEKTKNEIEFETNLAEEQPTINANGLKQNSNIAFDQPPQLEELKESDNNIEILPPSNIQLKEKIERKHQNLPLINSIAFQFEKPKNHETLNNPSLNLIPGDYQTEVLNELNTEENKKENLPNSWIENKTLINQEIEQNNLIVQENDEKVKEKNEENKKEFNEYLNKLNNIKNGDLINNHTTNFLILNEKLNNNLTENEINGVRNEAKINESNIINNEEGGDKMEEKEENEEENREENEDNNEV
uniref:Chitin-binding type-2 domain-containing protein n=1 Tax=Meloidogyne enterolobii TaxID=390850 RepID=A0A6V7VP27_MELEN|nr:unnamed protein product [Meloidogyne enterolobii]